MTDTSTQIIASPVTQLDLANFNKYGTMMRAEADRIFLLARHLNFYERLREEISPILKTIENIRTVAEPFLRDAKKAAEIPESFRAITNNEVEIVLAPKVYGTYPTFPTAEEIADSLRTKLSQQESTTSELLERHNTQVKIPVPAGANWNEIEIRFTSEAHSILVFHNDRKIDEYTHDEIGFSKKNTGNRGPNRPWGLLLQLSLYVGNKESRPATIEEIASNLNINRSACQKVKQELSQRLQTVFGIHDDPFYPYREVGGYKAKFALKPEPLLAGDGELHTSGGEYFDETTEKGIFIEQD
ncbi:MAG: hypothetical protein A3D92_04425 [Bacteroidetes bacterium RIFCSPHIGHO2_02_FULL_44_7]|nr:MAG: hypothetical protein A3D92_04425 [Bacteroidetes bacterium RIFCSPHIGHO2_02_FULL_44_7]